MAVPEKEVIKAYALENAIKYGGKANQGSVMNPLFAEGLEKSEIKEAMPSIQEVLKEVNALSLEEQEQAFSELKEKVHKREVRAEGELPHIPSAEEGKVVMRIAPFPSGPLHIGNARPLILNDEYCKMYKGKLHLVMDDTIGSAIKPIEPDAYKLIEEGVKWLGVKHEKKIFYKSDRTENYYKYAEELIGKGYMYVCNCENEAWKKLKDEKKECPCRSNEPETNLNNWGKMKTASEGSVCVRLKTSMQDPDPAFRDRVMFKISDRPHPRTGTKYRVYPSMEFSWAIDDHILGTTHVLRGIEHHMSTRVQDFIRDIFNWKQPVSIYNGHYEIEGVKISKSKGAKEVKSGEYTGWNDPRLWSLQSLRDRGLRAEAIREFILNMGITKTNSTVGVDILYAHNRKFINNSPKYLFVEDPQKIVIGGCPELNTPLPLHPTEKLGNRAYKTHNEFLIPREELALMNNNNYRLIHLLNFRTIKTGPTEKETFSFIGEKSDKNLGTKSIEWLPATPNNWQVKILMPNGEWRKGLGEPALEKVNLSETVFFEKFGFCKLHKKSKDELEFWFAHR